MTPPEIDAAVHQQLGELVTGMRFLQEANRRLEDMIRRQDDKSEESRSKVHRRMDDMVDRVGKVEGNLTVVQEDVKEMKPTIDDVKAWRQRGIGGLFIVGIGASALSFLLTQYFSSIIGWLTRTGP